MYCVLLVPYVDWKKRDESKAKTLCFRPDGSLVISENNLDVEEHKAALPNELAYSPDGKWLAVAGAGPARLGHPAQIAPG
jgi:hypothetical protein